MSKLIDKDMACRRLAEIAINDTEQKVADFFNEIIDRLPHVQITRCGECRWMTPIGNDFWCDCPAGGLRENILPENFCCYGERNPE